MKRGRLRFRGRRCESGVMVPGGKRSSRRGRVSHRSKVLARVVTTCGAAALTVVLGAALLSRCCEQDGDLSIVVSPPQIADSTLRSHTPPIHGAPADSSHNIESGAMRWNPGK